MFHSLIERTNYYSTELRRYAVCGRFSRPGMQMNRDDAGNGLHGLRATPSARLMALLPDRYGLERIEATRDLGSSSDRDRTRGPAAGHGPAAALVGRALAGAPGRRSAGLAGAGGDGMGPGVGA